MKAINKMITLIGASILLATCADLDIALAESTNTYQSTNKKNITTDAKQTTVTINAKDYGNLIGNGDDETTAIQKLFDSINKKYAGQKVIIKFPEGTYCTSRKITIYSNMTIEGVAGKTIMTNTKGQMFFMNGKAKGNYDQNAGSNITIKNITFKNSRVISMAHGSNITIDNINVIDTPSGHAFEIASCKDVTIKNSTFAGMNLDTDNALMRARDFNELIQLDVMTEKAFPSFGRYNDSNYQTTNENITIQNCKFKKSDNYDYPVAIGTHGVFTNEKAVTKNLIIKGCTFEDASFAAIVLPGIESMTIESNTFSNMNNSIKYNSDMKNATTSLIKINKNQFKNVNNGIYFEQYKGTKGVKKLAITNNTFNHSSNGNTPITLIGVSNVDSLSNTNNKVTNYSNNVCVINNTRTRNEAISHKATVVTQSTPVREDSYHGAKILTTLSKDSIYTIKDTYCNYWKKITTNGYTGYVYKGDLNYISTENIASGTITRNTDILESRTSSKTLGKITKGTKVPVVDTSNKKLIGIAYKNKLVYVSSENINISNNKSNNKRYVQKPGATKVDVYKDLDSTKNPVGYVPVNAEVLYTGVKVNNYAKIKYNNKTFYIYANNLAVANPNIRYVLGKGKAKIELYADSKNTSKVIGYAPNGSSVVYTGVKNNGYAQVEFEGKIGYIFANNLAVTKQS